MKKKYLALLNVLNSMPDDQEDYADVAAYVTQKTNGDPPNVETYRKKYLDYMQHPSYKERLGREMFGDNYNPTKHQKLVDVEYNKRLSDVKGAKIIPVKGLKNLGEYNASTNEIKYKAFDQLGTDSILYVLALLYHELAHATDKHGEDIRSGSGFLAELERFNIENKQPYIDISGRASTGATSLGEYNEDLKRGLLKKYLTAREYTETPIFDFTLEELPEYMEKVYAKDSLERRFSNIPSKEEFNEEFNKNLLEYNRLKDKTYRSQAYKNTELINFDTGIGNDEKAFMKDEYYNQPTEVKARLNEIRIQAINEGYNQDKDFDVKEWIKKIKNKSAYTELKNYGKYTDKQINELMKYVAQNETQQRDELPTYV